jgi:hypothetical protein
MKFVFFVVPLKVSVCLWNSLMITNTPITKTVSRSSVPITTITGISQTMAIRDGGSGGNRGDLGDRGGGSIAYPMAVSQGGGSSVAKTTAVSVTQTTIAETAVAQTAIAQTSKTTLLLRLSSVGADGQSKDDASLRQADRRR